HSCHDCQYPPGSTFFFQAEDGIRDRNVTGVQTCALPISANLRKSVTSILATPFSWAFPIIDVFIGPSNISGKRLNTSICIRRHPFPRPHHQSDRPSGQSQLGYYPNQSLTQYLQYKESRYPSLYLDAE